MNLLGHKQKNRMKETEMYAKSPAKTLHIAACKSSGKLKRNKYNLCRHAITHGNICIYMTVCHEPKWRQRMVILPCIVGLRLRSSEQLNGKPPLLNVKFPLTSLQPWWEVSVHFSGRKLFYQTFFVVFCLQGSIWTPAVLLSPIA